jgi:hypothetical protein
MIRHIFQACPVWIYTQSNITSIIVPSVCPPWETWRNIGRKQCFRNNVS